MTRSSIGSVGPVWIFWRGVIRRGLFMIGFALAFGAPVTAKAQDWPDTVRNLRIVIPDARGRNAYGKKPLMRSLRRTMREAVDTIDPSEFKRAQRTLRMRGRSARRPENLARAGRAIGAQYVLTVSVSKKGWLYTATARLINCETAEEQMNFRSQYYKPREETKDRGFRVAKRTIEKLDTLVQDGQAPQIPALATSDGPSVDAAPPPAPEPEDRDPGFAAPAPTTDGPDVTTEGLADAADVDPPPEPTTTEDPFQNDPPPPPVEAAPPPEMPPPPTEVALAPPPPPPSFAPPVRAEPRPTRVETMRPTPDNDLEIIRFSLGGGSGLLRTYTLSADNLDNSLLSYQLDPLSLAALDVEFIAPGIPLNISVQGAFRPVAYSVALMDQNDPIEANGFLLDISGRFGVAFPVSGQGRTAVRIIPWLGARLNVSDTSREASGVLISSNLISVGGGLTARLPFNDVLELGLGVEGGWIASYSESPSTTGDGGMGFTLAGDLNARIWLTDLIGIALDNRFTFERIGFDGLPTRQVPAQEEDAFRNAALQTQDLRTSLGIAFRI